MDDSYFISIVVCIEFLEVKIHLSIRDRAVVVLAVNVWNILPSHWPKYVIATVLSIIPHVIIDERCPPFKREDEMLFRDGV
jgi:hypothetical protein